MTRIRTLDFLPEVFQTAPNRQFLSATLDQIVNQPNTVRMQGYIGSKLGNGVNALDYYVTEPTKNRADYQLDPGVIFTKDNESSVKDFISYPGIIDALNQLGAITDNNGELFQSQFYSWDSFTNLDKLVNYNEYYWLPAGAPAVVVSPETVYTNENYVVSDYTNAYGLSGENEQIGAPSNPTITVLRGGVYTFAVNQPSNFWIQTQPGVTGFSETQPNLPLREVYGVSNNGANTGEVTFTVPASNAQDDYVLPGNNQVDVVSSIPFAAINGQILNQIIDPETGVSYPGVGQIDGITLSEGTRILFYNTGIPAEIGYVNSYYDETTYDQNAAYFTDPASIEIVATSSADNTLSTSPTNTTSDIVVNQTITFSGGILGGLEEGKVYFVSEIVDSEKFKISESLGGATLSLLTSSGSMTANINQGQYQQGFYTNINENFYRVSLVGDPANPTIRLLPDGEIPFNEKITAQFGNQWINRSFYRNVLNYIVLIPILTANLDVLYYQDGTNPNKVGEIRIIDASVDNFINVETQILGKAQYTSPTGVSFTNGLKILFEGNVYPESYKNQEFYVEGVGTSIELLPIGELECPEKFTAGEYNPWDILSYDEGKYDINLYLPIEQDYITIARNSINRNAWSRSNRWFHIDVITATSQYNNNPDIITAYATLTNKAKRPIIEFYPNLKLFNSGSVGKRAVDFFDVKATDALSNVAGLYNYYPDTEVSTANTAVITAELVPAVSTSIVVPSADIDGTFQVGMYIGDYFNILPTSSKISAITIVGENTEISVTWENPQTVAGGTAAVVATDTPLNNYAVFPGSRIVFANDTDLSVRNRIYVVNFANISTSPYPVLVLSLAEDAEPLANEMVAIKRGYNYQGKSFYFEDLDWTQAQQKLTVNQAPMFDVFDANGISFGNLDIYNSTSFKGSTLFSYAIGSGTDDPILGFPIKYSSVGTIGDIQFDITLNSQTFNYVSGFDSIIKSVNDGYVHDYTSPEIFNRLLGWQTTVAPSVQYQAFLFEFDPLNPGGSLVCDVPVLADIPFGEKNWPRIQVYVNNQYQLESAYTLVVDSTSTTVTLNTLPSEKSAIQVLVLSDSISSNAYFTIPVNLSNNPLNQDIDTVNLGGVRSHYADMFINSPATTGEIFGINNFRDCGNLVPYGTKIIQNSASMVLPGAILRKPDANINDALLFNSREYIKYKQLLVDTVQNSDYTQRFTPSAILDDAIDQISASKNEISSFFWSDMLPSKSAYRSAQYTFNSNLDVTRYPLSQTYDFTKASYNGVLVYLTRTEDNVPRQHQLLNGVDYIISTEEPVLTVTSDLQPGDTITIREYNQTYGSYVPNTPSKLGLYPLFQPGVVLDSNYSQPTYFIRGHDGSFTKLYGEFITETNTLIDFRDQALLEFECRIFNNCKLSSSMPIKLSEIIPGFFRTSSDYWNSWMIMYSQAFLNWVGQNRVDYKTQYFQLNNEWTYNYSSASDKLNNSVIQQGYWRGVYQYLYDTTTPNTTPWEMLGFTDQPTWWTQRYGPAPYTRNNEILWNDLEQGLVWNNGDPYTVSTLARPGLAELIPVDDAGNLLTPLYSVVGNYNPSTFQKDWKIGDMGPVELSYTRSSSYPFDIMRLMSMIKPAEFYNLAVDLDNYKYNAEFDQYLANDRRHLDISSIQVYGNGIAKTSYLNWIVDFQKQFGIDATDQIENMLKNLDVRLVYRLAGFSDKTLLNFYVEKSSASDTNSALLIPDESYSILLYDNQPFNRLAYSSLVVQQNNGYWTVFGNSQNLAYFTTLRPSTNLQPETITVANLSVKVNKNFTSDEMLIPYGTKFYSAQELAQFIANYAAYLNSRGMKFNQVVNGEEINWDLMIQEFLYWTQTGWEDGSIVTLNPAATHLVIDTGDSVVQPLTIQNQNFILNQNLYPIQVNTLCINRDDTLFDVHTLNQGDSMAYAQFNMGSIEHGVVFDNSTLFNDTIYDLVTGLRQSRITLRGTKTADWNGTVNAWGFILNQDNIEEWSKNIKYPKGSIVKYKNKYWTALEIVEQSVVFNESAWKIVNYQDIQKGMLPNAASRAYESTLYYDADKANLERDADLLSYSLIGYRPRDYLALADLSDITQINVYKNMIKNKGTRNATYAFKGANLPQGGIDYDVYENWAIKTGEFGGVLGENFVEFRLNQSKLSGNPSIVSLSDGNETVGSMQEVPLYSLFNYNRPITTPNILNVMDTTESSLLYPNAGYVNFNDIRMSSFYYSGLINAVDSNGRRVPIDEFYVKDYLWLANYKESWGVYSWSPVGTVVEARGNINGTSTIKFSQPHGLTKYDPVSIINFSNNVNGYYIVTDAPNLTEIVINLVIPNASGVSSIQGNGIAMKLNSHRVSQPSDIVNLNLLGSEFTKTTVWVDRNIDDSWAVYRKSNNYTYNTSLDTVGAMRFGSAVATSSVIGNLVADSDAGKVYRYSDDNTLIEVLSPNVNATSFGQAIAHSKNIVAISQSSDDPLGSSAAISIYAKNETQLTDELVLCQTIEAPSTVSRWGTSLTMSGDCNWMFVGAIDEAEVHVYQRQQIELSAGFFTAGKTYTITETGTTDFTLIGAIENTIGITFVATGVGSGTGMATQCSYIPSTIIDGSSIGYDTSDLFGSSIAVNNDASTIVIGIPGEKYSDIITYWGNAIILQRMVQKFDAEFTSVNGQFQEFDMVWNTNSIGKTVQSTNSVGNIITLNSASGINIDDPVVFYGNGLVDTNIQGYTVYYVASISGNNITIKTSRSSLTPVTVATKASITNASASIQTGELFVYKNGILVPDNNYAVIDTKFVYTTPLTAGDIITVSGNSINQVQTLVSTQTERENPQFGYSLDISTAGTEIVIGSPYEISPTNQEGQVYRFTNAGAKFGIIEATQSVDIMSDIVLLINGYAVNIAAGSSTAEVAAIINQYRIPNIQATVVNDILVLQVIDRSIADINNKLSLTAMNSGVFESLGISVYNQTQIISCPHPDGQTQFGKAVKMNRRDSVAIGAPAATRFSATEFDFTDDENIHNDMVFDNNATTFLDADPNFGAVYTFDLLYNANSSLVNPGAFVYAQSTNSQVIEAGISPEYGMAIDFSEHAVIIGSPGFLPNIVGGQAVVYVNYVGNRNWTEYRQSSPVVDTSKIQNTQLFSASTNNTLALLDYIDPLQGKILGIARENIDFVSASDPARYNNQLSQPTGMTWMENQVGKIWFDTSLVRFINYHQNDPDYNSKYWGSVFPGSEIAVYTWVASTNPPSSYTGPGNPFDVTKYSIGNVINSSNVITPIYYFWVRNTGVVSSQLGKTLSDTIIASYIENPRASGIAYMTPLLPNAFALYNTADYINATDTIFHIGYSNGETNDVSHTEYTLIRENFTDDFLPGLPTIFDIPHGATAHGLFRTSISDQPSSLYARLLDSLSGCNIVGETVPDPFLPLAVQSGIQVRPRQSFFYNRLLALKNYLQYANAILLQYPITELKPDIALLFMISPVKYDESGAIIFDQGQEYDTTQYWEYVNWWAEGYGNSTRAVFQVQSYADLSALDVAVGTIVKVEQNGAGLYEMYRYDGNTVWTRIGLENGTIQVKESLWNYEESKTGFGGDFFDTVPYDFYPSQETRFIIRALNEQIYTGDLSSYRNKSLILLFEYIQSETTESQNFLPWLSKTSLVDVSHTVRELKPLEVFKSDNELFLEGYINEVKPYHVVLKEFLFDYSGNEDYTGNITDFDVPATWNSRFNKFISPQLTNDQTSCSHGYRFGEDADIWNTAPYYEWFNNKGLTLVSQPNTLMTSLSEFMTIGSSYILVDNSNGFPINGVITIDDEQISYVYVNRALNILGGIVRGINGTQVSNHYPGANVYMDLSPVMVMESGRGYTDVPKVEALVDTTLYSAPTRPAILQAVMSGGSVNSILVIDPGQGYMVTPEIVIEPAYQIQFTNQNVNSVLHTIDVYAPYLQTGDQLRFVAATNGASPTKLVNNSWYYVGILESSQTNTIALYTSFADAVKDHNRIEIEAGPDVISSMTLLPGAKAAVITAASPTREMNIGIKFDRTSYRSQVIDWQTGAYYGAYFAGAYFNPNRIASSSYTLENTIPSITGVLASAQGAVFEISKVTNDDEVDWSSYIRYVDSTIGASNSIKIVPQDGNNPDLSDLMPNASGSTVGLVKNMPIKFVGQVVGGLQENVVYYVSSVISETEFTVSLTIDGSEVALTDQAPIANLLRCYTGETVGTTILTVNYPGILNVSQTNAVTNAVTVPRTAIGTGGTTGFYTELPVRFTDEVFGNIIENRVYYVTSVIDDETFTISEIQTPTLTIASATYTGSNTVEVASTSGFSVNDPIIFSGTSIGGIVNGQLYYVSEVIDGTTLTISTEINGQTLAVTTDSGTMTLVNQKDTVALASMNGNMTMNVSLPVSPGQINGQCFTLYQTSGQYPTLTPVTYGELIKSEIDATISTVDKIALVSGSDMSAYYVNMPLRLDSVLTGSGLSTGIQYYIMGIGNIQITATTTSSVGNIITCDSTSSLYANMPVVFDGYGLGGIIINQVYYVETITSPTTFTISETIGGTAVTLTTANGQMIGVGTPYIVVTTTVPGSGSPVAVSLGDTYSGASVSLTQNPNPTTTDAPVFDVSAVMGGYQVSITNQSTGFATGNTMTIPGTLVGGISPLNDLTLKVNDIGSTGEILNVIASGEVPTASARYYVEVRSPNTLAVYADSTLSVSVPSSEFAFDGFTTDTVTYMNATTDEFTISDTSKFSVNDEVVFTGNTTQVIANQSYYIYEILSATQFTVSTVPGVGATKVNINVSETVDFTIGKAGSFAFLPEPFNFNQSIVRFNGRLYKCVISNNDTDFVLGKWQEIGSDYETLNALDRAVGYYRPTANMPGLDLTQLFDNVTYPYPTVMGNKFQPDQQYLIDTVVEDTLFTNSVVPLYTIKDTDFSYGYGPEELVPGNITDNIALAVNTRPGTNWPVEEYGHVGYNTASIEIFPTPNQRTFSFVGITETPASIFVQEIDGSTKLGRTISPDEYSVDWVNKTVTLNTALPFWPVQSLLRIDCFDVGNGDQLIKSNTDRDPIRVDQTSLFTEIYVNCAYSKNIYQGSGIVRTGTTTVETLVSATDGITDRITCTNVNDFVLNTSITFQGSTFGGLTEDTVYYVKTISYATNSITVSLTRNSITGVAEATFPLTTATGSMYAIISTGNSAPWTDPAVYHNGIKLRFGINGLVTKTTAGTNTITTATTSGMSVGDAITFCNCMFGNVIVPLTRYYVKTIVDGNEFTIAATPGGATLSLSDATGGSLFITNDFSFGIQPDGISAKIMFSDSSYTNSSDYLVYSLFGETTPEQYGYTLPEVEYISADGITITFPLSNYVGGDNPTNAIVEIDGYRLNNNRYTIDPITSTITVVADGSIDAPVVEGQTISVLTYNDTRRQYLTSQYDISGSVSAIVNVNNNIVNPITGTVNATSATTNGITISSSAGTVGFISGQPILFKGTSIGGINTTGTVYYVRGLSAPNFVNGIAYTISVLGTTNWNAIGYVGTPAVGGTFTATGAGTGTGEAFSQNGFRIADYDGNIISLTTASASPGNDLSIEVGGTPAVRITTRIAHNLVDNDLVRVDAIKGSTQLNNNTYYVKYINPMTVDLYQTPYDFGQYAVNNPVMSVSNYDSGGYIWQAGSFFISGLQVTETSLTGNTISASSVDHLVVGTPIYFNKVGQLNGDNLLGGLIQGVEYFVRDVNTGLNVFTVSSTRYGDPITLTNAVGSINAVQWSQTDVDRLWVTINGARVPSSQLRINDINEISILAEILPSDTIIITSMIPTATPQENTYRMIINSQGETTIYKANAQTTTWITSPVYPTSTSIQVHNVNKLAVRTEHTINVPVQDGGSYYIGLSADKRMLSSVSVFNITKGISIDSSNYEVVIVDIAPQLRIVPGTWISTGDELSVTCVEGRILYVNGEQIGFDNVDEATNTISGLKRGINGTAVQTHISVNTPVFGMIADSIMPSVLYDTTWNSYDYNIVDGDPLQISSTMAAIFLNSDIK